MFRNEIINNLETVDDLIKIKVPLVTGKIRLVILQQGSLKKLKLISSWVCGPVKITSPPGPG